MTPGGNKPKEKLGHGSHFLQKAQETGFKDILNECTNYRYDLQAMKMPSTELMPKKRKD